MSRQSLNAVRSQAGFTLVELAVVMIIIGLLIGGVLKGQELIGNAQVTATVAQLKGIEAATSTFRDTYNAFPGDMLNPQNRLPSCSTSPCNQPGNGDGRLLATPGSASAANENQRFFVHLSAADLLTGIVPGADVPGGNYPAGKLNNTVIQAGYAPNPAGLAAAVDSTDASSGHYMRVSNSIAASTTASGGLRPSEALRIDSKMDDGVPGSGSVRGIGGVDCGSTGAAGTYSTSSAASTCGVYVRFQG